MVLFHPVDEGLARDGQVPRCLGDVPAAVLESLADHHALELLQRYAPGRKGDPEVPTVRRDRDAGGLRGRWAEVRGADDAVVLEKQDALDTVAELADVSGP